jgi:hypothetical protein
VLSALGKAVASGVVSAAEDLFGPMQASFFGARAGRKPADTAPRAGLTIDGHPD